jgi:serine/threonine-protein kinase
VTETDQRSAGVVGIVLEGAYRITRLIGEGGMGAVYEAVQLRLNKRVAVKLMVRDLAANQEALARFHREAEITSHLGHPHLVTVVDFGQAESGEPYLVMEYLEGEDLDQRLRRVGRMPIETVVHVVKQVASALGAAHDQGVVHRDLKPGNVFLLQIPGEPDFVKVLDFGISKMKAARTQLTSASAVMGTPNYMSPEQATGMVEEIDHHADQWALACIAWQMLLGRGPFVADEVTAILYQIINLDPHPLAPRVPGLPPAVETVLRRALSKRPADRFASIREFSRAFEAAASGRPADATPAPVAVAVPTTAPADATIGYGGTPVSRAPARAPAAHVLRDGRKPDADPSQVDDEPVRAAPWRRIKPIHAVIATAGVLLLLVAFLLIGTRRADMRPSPTPVAVPKPTLLPAASHRPAPIPTITPLPDPAPPPAAAATPEASPPPAARAGEAKPSVARRLQPVGAAKSHAEDSFDVDKFIREHDQRKAQELGPSFGARTKRWQDPFADSPSAPPGAKQAKKPISPAGAEPPPTRKTPHKTRQLIEEL